MKGQKSQRSTTSSQAALLVLLNSLEISYIEQPPLVTGRTLNVHKTLRRRPGRLLNVYVRLVYVICPRGIVEKIIKLPISLPGWSIVILPGK